MRVLQLSCGQIWRGAEQQIVYLIEGLRSKAIECFVACRKRSLFEEYCQKEDIPHFSLAFANEVDLWSAYRVASFCRKNQIDILHTHSGHALAIGVWANILGAPARHIHSRRVLYPINDNALSRLKFNRPSVRRIVCVSNSIREVMAASVRFPDRCVTVHSGVDVGRFSRTKETGSLRQEFDVPEDCQIITNISALSDEKDCLTFVSTAEKVLNTGGKATFFLVGEGPERQAIETRIRQKGLERDIVLTGFRQDIPEILADTDLFIMTSRIEGLGTSVLDAFANRLPVVATAAGGIPEMVRHGETGLLAPVGDADALAKHVLSLLGNRAERQRLGDKARIFLEKEFTEGAMVEKTLALYQEVVRE
jgi:glycosyltransferase involved in cell wall biosynthesis